MAEERSEKVHEKRESSIEQPQRPILVISEEEVEAEVLRRVKARYDEKLNKTASVELENLKAVYNVICAVFGNIGYFILFVLRVACIAYVLCHTSSLYRLHTGNFMSEHRSNMIYVFTWISIFEGIVFLALSLLISARDRKERDLRLTLLVKDGVLLVIAAIPAFCCFVMKVPYDFGLTCASLFSTFSIFHFWFLFFICMFCIRDIVRQPENLRRLNKADKVCRFYANDVFEKYF